MAEGIEEPVTQAAEDAAASGLHEEESALGHRVSELFPKCVVSYGMEQCLRLRLGHCRAVLLSLYSVCTETYYYYCARPLVGLYAWKLACTVSPAPAKGLCGTHLTLCAQKPGVPVLCDARVSEVAGQGARRAAAGGGGDLWRGGFGPGANAGAPGFSKRQLPQVLGAGECQA